MAGGAVAGARSSVAARGGGAIGAASGVAGARRALAGRRVGDATGGRVRTPVRVSPRRVTGLVNNTARHLRDGQCVEWRRRELNPRPKTAAMTASTCLVQCFDLGRRADHGQPARQPRRLILASCATSDAISQPAVFGCRVAGVRVIPQPPFIRRPDGPAHRSRCDRKLRYRQLCFARMIYEANQASSACHRHRCHPVETDRPR